jgi:hypothetical protein
MKKFTLRSGNSTTFKNMGSSPLHKHDGTTSATTHYKDGSAKSKREVDFSKQHEQEIAKEANKKKSGDNMSYFKRKEELLKQGFSQVEADQMIREGGVTGNVETKPKRDKEVEEKVKKTKSPAKTKVEKTANTLYPEKKEETVEHTFGDEKITKEQFEARIKGLQSGEIKPDPKKELKRIRTKK